MRVVFFLVGYVATEKLYWAWVYCVFFGQSDFYYINSIYRLINIYKFKFWFHFIWLLFNTAEIQISLKNRTAHTRAQQCRVFIKGSFLVFYLIIRRWASLIVYDIGVDLFHYARMFIQTSKILMKWQKWPVLLVVCNLINYFIAYS